MQEYIYLIWLIKLLNIINNLIIHQFKGSDQMDQLQVMDVQVLKNAVKKLKPFQYMYLTFMVVMGLFQMNYIKNSKQLEMIVMEIKILHVKIQQKNSQHKFLKEILFYIIRIMYMELVQSINPTQNKNNKLNKTNQCSVLEHFMKMKFLHVQMLKVY